MPRFTIGDLPREVREALYNLDPESTPLRELSGDQLAFYCFNYGAARALSFAAGLPRVCLESAARRRGFRPKGRALLAAVLRYREVDTVHLTFEGVDVSIFLLPELAKHVEGQALTLTGLLATKAHAILDRGTRRDFFDLYVLLETQRLGLSDVLRALSAVYEQPIHQGLFLRAFGYFDDAAAEAPLPGEGKADFKLVQTFFTRAVGALVVPPNSGLEIQARQVDASPAPKRKGPSARKTSPKRSSAKKQSRKT